MKKRAAIFLFLLVMPACVFSAICPAYSCPAGSLTPVLSYHFENDLSDSSGHSLNAGWGDNIGTCPPSFFDNIGGRPGYSVGGFVSGNACGLSLPACPLDMAEGEIEWYQFVTSTPVNQANVSLFWCSMNCQADGWIMLISGNGGELQPDFFTLNYSYMDANGLHGESLSSETLIFNQWQHISIHWGSFGVRLLVDGVQRVGSLNPWYRINSWPTIFLGSGPDQYINDMFYGYFDDFNIWPCSSFSAPLNTFTPTATAAVLTDTPTPEETFTASPSCTSTITPSCTPAVSFTNTRSATATPSFSATPSVTASPTSTVSPVFPDTGFVGIFPNPASDIARVVFVSHSACKASFEVYSVSGEKTSGFSKQAGAGLNALEIRLKNSSGITMSSGSYYYRLELDYGNKKTRIFDGKFAVAR